MSQAPRADGLLRLTIKRKDGGRVSAAAHALQAGQVVRLSQAQGDFAPRSAEFMGQPIIDVLVWMRVPGDTIFSLGALTLSWFVLRLWIAPGRERAVAVDLPATG